MMNKATQQYINQVLLYIIYAVTTMTHIVALSELLVRNGGQILVQILQELLPYSNMPGIRAW
ncbi:MAG: hypothetical protein HQK60_13510 [Deltaproteobacteria bacterium]|nr:hypothetical protein [Deltaproteobacteria bacterium]